MPSALKVRKPTLQDLPEIFTLLKQLWPDKRFNKNAKKVFAKGLRNPSQRYLVAKHEGKIVGFASVFFSNGLWEQGNTCYLEALIVDKSHRGEGFGRQLMAKIMRLARRKECKCVELDSAARRKRAHLFYKRQGFKKTGFYFSKDI